ncbi:MAG: GntR family transcriptional regulator [Kiritimatiellae bacterium]|jgi:GntR family transcriptional regulator|nr:GntR family transcriptional regulator [Kiritimatiellia bacterium]MDD4341331.1 GntR family transcriptional regulator [Kiritimatiellia bacterium]MDY0149338.1 GntR family transcriptional regulator [Kiritimatiellia bacterium]
MLPFHITFQPGLPVYQQVIFAVKKAIVTGQLTPGDRFPSIRQMSQELRINPNTVQKVVRGLVEVGLLKVVPGVGTLVGKSPPPSSAEKKTLLEDQVGRLVVEACRMSLSKAEVVEAIADLWPNQERVK